MKLKRKRYLVLALAIVLLMLAGADFLRWVTHVSRQTRPVSPTADAIVALTGGSGKRIKTAISLLEEGAGERLLVSGVNIKVDARDLIKTAGGTEALFACCIDIGHMASSTRENAIETAAWAREKGYDQLILVTSDYHIPRSRLWFRNKAPDIAIIPYPMQSQLSVTGWWRSWKSIKGLVIEWAKYRVTGLLVVF